LGCSAHIAGTEIPKIATSIAITAATLGLTEVRIRRTSRRAPKAGNAPVFDVIIQRMNHDFLYTKQNRPGDHEIPRAIADMKRVV